MRRVSIIASERKEELYVIVDRIQDTLIQMSHFIFDNPELGNKEFKAHELLTGYFEEQGFSVEKEIIGLRTAFRATYTLGKGGYNIGLLCEYDALEGLGHACGHHMQAPAIAGAAIALAKGLENLNATITVIGTPAEETTSAKIPMVKAGIFNNLDVAFMMHAGDCTTVDGKSLALNLVDFIFEGKASHAAIAPDKGISALDAVLMTFNGIEYLREHVRPDVRIHGVITDGGKAANIVPERAAAQFYIRADDRPYLETVVERVYNVARGAALATSASLTINEQKAYDNKVNVEALNQLVLANARSLGAPNITPPRKLTGSTDFSCVTYLVPGACLRIGFIAAGVSSHSIEWLEAAKSKQAHNAIVIAAKVIAGSCYDLLESPELMGQIKQAFDRAKSASAK